jgi:Cupin-like domain
MTDVNTIDKSWLSWLLENLSSGTSESGIEVALQNSGLGPDEAKELISSIRHNVLFESYKSNFLKKQKLECLLELDYQCKSRLHTYDEVAVYDWLQPSAFFREYFLGNKPVVVRQWTKDWPALKKWDIGFFKSSFGDEEVEITHDRDNISNYDTLFSKSRKKITVREYADLVLSNPESNNFYLVARNFLLANPRFACLFEDFSPITDVIDPAGHNGKGFVKIWIGPKGTISKLHHDRVNVLLVQVTGRKLIKFIPPNQIHKVYNNIGTFSQLDLEKGVDEKKFTKAKDIRILETIVYPGDAILIPVGWWHWVKSLDISITLTHQKFCIENGNIMLHDNFWR